MGAMELIAKFKQLNAHYKRKIIWIQISKYSKYWWISIVIHGHILNCRNWNDCLIPKLHRSFDPKIIFCVLKLNFFALDYVGYCPNVFGCMIIKLLNKHPFSKRAWFIMHLQNDQTMYQNTCTTWLTFLHYKLQFCFIWHILINTLTCDKGF
jgi:hypothetical protein